MLESKEQIITIIAVISILLFLGVMFLVMVLYYNNKKMLMRKERQMMKDMFEKQLLQSKLEIQEQTFNFISQEIHDNVGQVLSLAKVQLNIMEQKQELDTIILKDVKVGISNAMRELRDIAKSLSSEKTQSFNFLQNVEDDVNRINRSGLIKASIKVSGSCCFIRNQHKVILFRLIQESLQNILKHAQASEIDISISGDDKKLNIVIRDNGIGFNVETELKKDSGLGLKNIINRASLIGGVATIESTPINGSTINIMLVHE